MKVNFSANQSVKFNVLSASQVEEIVSTSFNILERVGIDVNDAEVLSLLKDAGCLVRGIRVFIPSFLVNECVAIAPK
ncbi:MAG: trimethylamine methyltransferase, partial [Actinobacteria bacterium]|nr:trimethylamine methyltransferase [Actinomycetota bacterium]